MRTIVVTGATGALGRAVVERLTAERDIRVRAATRRPERHRSDEGVGWVEFDWDMPDGAAALVAGADALFVMPPAAHHPLPATQQLIDRAAAAGVSQVVFLSTLGADFDPGFAFGRWALTGEQAVAASGLPYTVLRPNSFMQNFLSMQRPGTDGALRLPWGNASTSFVDIRDIAAVAARILVEPDDHAGVEYELTGPAALDLDAVAVLFRDASREPIHYVHTPPETVSAMLTERGMSPPMATAFMELHAVMASSARGVVTDHVQRVTGRRPLSFAEFAADHAAVWTQPTIGAANGLSRG